MHLRVADTSDKRHLSHEHTPHDYPESESTSSCSSMWKHYNLDILIYLPLIYALTMIVWLKYISFYSHIISGTLNETPLEVTSVKPHFAQMLDESMQKYHI